MPAFCFGPLAQDGSSSVSTFTDRPRIFPSRLLWEAATGEPIAARVAIAADFSPPSSPMPSSWTEEASSLAVCFDDIDTTFLNFEAAIGADLVNLFPQRDDFVAAPPEALDYLDRIKARAVSVANDHSYDLGPSGFGYTKELLLRRGMVPLGAGKTLRKAPAAWVWRGPAGIRVGFWAAARASLNGATRTAAGVEPATLDRALYALECLRYHQAQCCVALLNFGPPVTFAPAWSELELMDSLAKWGFDIVCASHSPHIRGARFVEGHRGNPAFAFHGLGNLASRADCRESQREGLIVVAGLDMQGSLVQVELRPVVVGEEGFAVVPSAAVGTAILEKFERLSRDLAARAVEQPVAPRVSREIVEFPCSQRTGVSANLHRTTNMMRVRQLVQKLIG